MPLLLAPWCVLLAVAVPPVPGEPETTGAEASPEPPDAGGDRSVHRVERGPDFAPLYLPEDEELVFRVDVKISLIETAVARCTMSSTIEEYRPPLLLGPGADAEPEEDTVVLKLHALGDHLLYSMDALMETRMLPQDWPATVHRYVQKGSESRRRETLLGEREGRPTSSYRRDTSSGAPRGTRVWVDPVLREIPPGTVDMMAGIYLIRTMIRDDLERLRFPMVDKKEVWDVTLSRGRSKLVRTKAGRFRAIEVLLETGAFAGEEVEEEFSGPFGLEGAIHLWVEASTGVPVLITGDLPAGPLTLGVEIRLESYSGTPEGFQPVERTEGGRGEGG